MAREAPRGRVSRLTATGSAAVLVALLLAAAAPGLITTADPLAQDATMRLLPPGPAHLLGTDGFGRDVLSRLLHGARASLGCAFAAVGAAGILGVPLGTASARRRGPAGPLLQGATAVLLSVPFLLLAMVIVTSLTLSFTSVTLAIAAGLVAPTARMAEAAARVVLVQPYVDAARIAGAGPVRILVRHVLPNALPVILTHLTGALAVAISAEATLSFLGLGIPAPWPSWGRMLQEGARQHLESAPWIAGSAGVAIALAAAGAALLGDALADLVTPDHAPPASRRRLPR
jgi:peptide/nickel transport system permease protein